MVPPESPYQHDAGSTGLESAYFKRYELKANEAYDRLVAERIAFEMEKTAMEISLAALRDDIKKEHAKLRRDKRRLLVLLHELNVADGR